MMTFYGVMACKELGIPYRVCFCNTGREHPKTYEFIENVSQVWGIHVTWIEVDYESKTGFKEVNFITANRDGKPLEDAIKRYGIYNVSYPHCTRETKTRIFKKWRRLNKIDYSVIGIRADEFDRVSDNAEKERLLYPLVWANIQKADVLEFFKTQPFDLEIPEHLGNCVTCFKKSIKKLCMVALEHPEYFEFDRRIEKLYSHFRPESQPNRPLPARLHRGNRTVDDILKLLMQERNPTISQHNQGVTSLAKLSNNDGITH